MQCNVCLEALEYGGLAVRQERSGAVFPCHLCLSNQKTKHSAAIIISRYLSSDNGRGREEVGRDEEEEWYIKTSDTCIKIFHAEKISSMQRYLKYPHLIPPSTSPQ